MIPPEVYPHDTPAAAARGWPSLCRVDPALGPFPSAEDQFYLAVGVVSAEEIARSRFAQGPVVHACEPGRWWIDAAGTRRCIDCGAVWTGGAGAILRAAEAEVGPGMPTDSPRETCASAGPLSASPKVRIGVPLDEIGQLVEGEGPGAIGMGGE